MNRLNAGTRESRRNSLASRLAVFDSAGTENWVMSPMMSAGSALWFSLAAAMPWCAAREPCGRVGEVGRNRRDHHCDAIAVGILLVLGADRHGHRREQWPVGQSVVPLQP